MMSQAAYSAAVKNPAIDSKLLHKLETQERDSSKITIDVMQSAAHGAVRPAIDTEKMYLTYAARECD